MQRDLALQRELGERRYVIDDTVGEVGRGADDEDGVAVNEARDAGYVHFVRRCRTGY